VPPGSLRQRTHSVKCSAGWQDVTGMVTQAQPALAGNRTRDWWPSKYGPDYPAGALNEITAKLRGATSAWVEPLAIV
jgi:hypothetical protein